MFLIKNKFFLLYFFHIFVSVLFNAISYTSFLNSLHNGRGIWNFMRDTILYHNESLILLNYLKELDLYNYFLFYNEHLHTKIISILYYITNFHYPASYIPFHSLIWTLSVLFLYKSTKIVYNNIVAYISVIPLFFVSYLTLYMGLLRESLNIFAYILLIFCIINIRFKNENKKIIFLFMVSFSLLIIVRPYLIIIFFTITLLTFIIFYIKNFIKFSNFFIVVSFMLVLIFFNSKSLIYFGLKDEHLELQNYIYSFFYDQNQNIELETKKISLANTRFLTTEFIDNSIKEAFMNENFVNDKFDYALLKKETRNLNLKESIIKIINISVSYNKHKKLNDTERSIYISSLNQILKELMRFETSKLQHILRNLVVISTQDLVLIKENSIKLSNKDTVVTNNNLSASNDFKNKNMKNDKENNIVLSNKDMVVTNNNLSASNDFKNKNMKNDKENNIVLSNKDMVVTNNNLSASNDFKNKNMKNDKENNIVLSNKDMVVTNNNELLINNNCIFGTYSIFAIKFDKIRKSFDDVNLNSGSNAGQIDLISICDMFYYLPKIISDSFLSPYPYMWFQSGTETGKIGRSLSGIETLITYFYFFGFLGLLIFNRSNLIILLPVIFYSLTIIVLTGYAVPNYGAIYRMRMGPLIIFYMMGSYGLYLMYNKVFYGSRK